VQDAALLVNRYDWIGLVAALNEPRYAGFRVARQPRNHAKLLAFGQLYHQVGLFEWKFRRSLNHGAQFGGVLMSHVDLSRSQGQPALSEKRQADQSDQQFP
jgi:hypothetical protein